MHIVRLFQGDTVSVTFYGVNPRLRTRIVSGERFVGDFVYPL